MNSASEDFVLQLTRSQTAIYASILSILPDRVAAADVLQETNLTLWRKADAFEPGTNFVAWAVRIAHYHVLNYRRRQQRDKLVFDDQLFDELCARQIARADDQQQYHDALRNCLQKLSPDHRDLLNDRYAPGGSVKAIAKSQGKTEGAISQSLHRIRESLLNCIHFRIREFEV